MKIWIFLEAHSLTEETRTEAYQNKDGAKGAFIRRLNALKQESDYNLDPELQESDKVKIEDNAAWFSGEVLSFYEDISISYYEQEVL